MVQAAVEAQLFGETTHPVTVGRYTIQGPLGTGGMGSVHRAYDPELQREVALKLLRAERMGDASTRSRLVQEARAMARLSHPNVAMVFEVGEADGHLFVAMELIDGRDLRHWLDEGPRPWRESLALFLAAGQGLHAAHGKGLVHRDFKPENVVLDEEGRPRVVDFGLAREQSDPPTEQERAPAEISSALAPGLTTTGTLLGTPAYMSPEQWSGGQIDARSDQFSFCVSLWEALYGQRPFSGEDMATLMATVTEGTITEPRPGPVPGRILRALRRGLATHPAERWPDMSSLLAALRPPSRRGWMLGGAAAVVLAATGGIFALSEGSAGDACRRERDRLAGIWDEPRREGAARGIRATGLPYAEAVWAATSNRLDDYADRWAAEAESSCAGALTQTDAARARYRRQQRCLEDARALLGQFSAELAEADEATVVDAAQAATRLPDLAACADDRRLMIWAEEDSPARQATLERARAALARARRSLAEIDTAAGGTRYESEIETGRAAATEAQQAAVEVGHRPLEAEASLALGRLLLKFGEKQAAERSLSRAMQSAEAAGDAITRVRARIYLIYVLGTDRDRTTEAITLGEQSLAQLDGLGPRPLLRARLLSNMATGIARARRPDTARALELHEEAVALLREQLGEHHPSMISAQLNQGRALAYAGRPEEAVARLRPALERARAVWGEHHPHTARVWGMLGLALAYGESFEEAEAALRRSLEARERSLGPGHQEVASALYNLGSTLRRRDRHAEAVEYLRRGLTIRRRLQADDNNLIPWLFAIGDSEVKRGEHAAAREVLREALVLAETDGALPYDFARVRFGLARATAPEDPVAARLMGQAARDAFVNEGQSKGAAEVEAFLRGLGRRGDAGSRAPGSTDGVDR